MGCTLRRLVAKIAGNKVRDDMVALLAPRQLGFGVRSATRQYLSSLQPDHVVVKLDFRISTLFTEIACSGLFKIWPLKCTFCVLLTIIPLLG